jgi:hypothetical protein
MKIKGTGEMGHTGLMTDSGMRISGESDTRRRLTAIYDYFLHHDHRSAWRSGRSRQLPRKWDSSCIQRQRYAISVGAPSTRNIKPERSSQVPGTTVIGWMTFVPTLRTLLFASIKDLSRYYGLHCSALK